MRVLDEVVRSWVTAIANNQLEAIPNGVEKIHPARAATEHALEKGEYRPPKGEVEGFKRQDEEFHDSLVALLKAARAKDLPAATRQLGVVLEGCTGCHVKYRF
jgi:cytochrome c556